MDDKLSIQIEVAKKIIQTQNLIIDRFEYEILAVSLHTCWPQHEDPIVNQKKPRKFKSWFAYNENYNRYLDYDISKNQVIGGIRINCIRQIDNPLAIYKTAGDVYDHIKKCIGDNELISYSNSKLEVKKENTPLLYFKKKSKPLTRKTYLLPRYGEFNNLPFKFTEYRKFIFQEKMITNSLDWLIGIENPSSQIIPISLSLALKGEETFLINNKITTSRKLNRYKSFFETGTKTKDYPRNIKKPLSAENLCELLGYFSSQYANLISSCKKRHP